MVSNIFYLQTRKDVQKMTIHNEKIGTSLYNRSKRKSVLTGCAFLAFIGIADYLTGHEEGGRHIDEK